MKRSFVVLCLAVCGALLAIAVSACSGPAKNSVGPPAAASRYSVPQSVAGGDWPDLSRGPPDPAISDWFCGTGGLTLSARPGGNWPDAARTGKPFVEDELWIIVPAEWSNTDDQTPGCGSLVAYFGDLKADVPVPLEHTDVRASVTGYVASVHVQQRFHNPYSGKIEAEYVFPLPQNAAVDGFVMTVGERTIRGVVRKREEAERIYNAARAQGEHAALLNQERPNIFTQKVANLEPDQRIDVDITYFHTLAYVDGWFEYVFPMVVGPRYNPASVGSDGVGAVARWRGVSRARAGRRRRCSTCDLASARGMTSRSKSRSTRGWLFAKCAPRRTGLT